MKVIYILFVIIILVLAGAYFITSFKPQTTQNNNVLDKIENAISDKLNNRTQQPSVMDKIETAINQKLGK